MLLGEYAVLHGHHALVCSIDKRIHVTLTPREDSKIILDSALGHCETTLAHLDKVAPFQFVLATLHAFKKFIRKGCHIQIESEFSATVGFASSAAVTVATLAALLEWSGLNWSKTQMIKQAREIVRNVQGNGSGADVAGCVLGGIVFYRMQPFVAEKLDCLCPLTVVYSGYKTPTAIAIHHVQEKFADYPELFSRLMSAINECTLRGFSAINRQDWKTLGNIMNIQQVLMDALGVNTEEINGILQLVRRAPGVSGAKISGSGMGDCVVALGECLLDSSEMPAGAEQIRINMASEGVRSEKV